MSAMIGMRTGVYVDVANIVTNGGYGMQFDVLRDFACRDRSAPIRLNAYVVYDGQKMGQDPEYRRRIGLYHAAIRDIGFKVIEKPLRWYSDESGHRCSDNNADLQLSVDALLESRSLSKLLIVSGDGGLAPLVSALQSQGCRVEVLAFRAIAAELKRAADLFVSGYLVPSLLPVDSNVGGARWGETGSRVRGFCYHYDEEKGFGFMRFIKAINDNLHVTDGRAQESPFGTSFFHVSHLPSDFDPHQLPSRDHIFEFTLEQRPDQRKKDPIAIDIVTV